MSTTEVTAATGQDPHREQELGPLAWVLEALRKSLDAAVKATHRFVREAQEVRDSDLAALDSSPLRTAKQQLHQSCGALEMVGMPQAALLLRAMESAVQHYVKNPADCTDAVAQTLEKASFALLEFLESVLAGQHLSAVALFPQYRDVKALYGHERTVHPADLWSLERRWRDPDISSDVPPQGYTAAQRQVLDTAVLQIIKGIDIAAASARMRNVCLGYAQAQTVSTLRIFWKVAGAYFDAMAHGLLQPDIYTKRIASRVLMASAALAKGDAVAPERLLQEMLFFCAQAAADAPAAQAASTWKAVYTSFGLQQHVVVDYEQVRFGRFDPALLAQVRKRIASATDIWSSLAGGEIQKIQPAFEQFTLVTDSLTKLHPSIQYLAKALMQVMQSVVTRGQPPSAEVAMEVATAVLYLQAAFASLDLADATMAMHGETLGQRLTAVLAGEPAKPLEPWMEQLYRQVSDQQTMGSVVGELRVTLGATEKLLDQYFRNPADATVLGPVAAHLSQMRGVLSVLGLDQASLAMVRMRQNVERLRTEEVPEPEQKELFEKMANSLGALGFLIDMLSYQRHMARKLYVFDEASGELKLLMGRVRVHASDAEVPTAEEGLPQVLAQRPAPPLVDAPQAPAQIVAPAAAPHMAPPSKLLDAQELPAAPLPPEPEELPLAPAAVALAPEDSDSELLGIFLEEAREVVAHGRAALQVLAEQPAHWSEQTVLRRAFHTLKGSSRMVGLDEFGQAGWAMEQMLNAWLAEQKAMPVPMQQLALQALHGLEAWTNAIASQAAQDWQSAPFRASADAMRLDARFLAIDMAAVQGKPSSDAAALELDAPLNFDAPQPLAVDASREMAQGEATTPEYASQAVSAAQVVTASLEAQEIRGDAFDALLEASDTPVVLPADVPDTDVPAIDGLVKKVGPLSVPLPLFNAYLGEAEDWSYRLLDSLTAWSEHLEEGQPDMANACAHSLAGSSATVGVTVPSQLARKLEHALLHVLAQPQGVALQVQCFVRAAQAIRSMLHQVAAGVLPTENAEILAQLQQILDSDVQAVPARHEPLQPILAADDTDCTAQHGGADSDTRQDPRDGAQADDIDALNAMDPDLFPVFEEEAGELLSALETAMREWATHPTRLDARATLLRALHTLKGSARLAGAMRMGEMAHHLESALEALDAHTATTAHIEPLFTHLDAIDANFNALRAAAKLAEAAPVRVEPVAAAVTLPPAQPDWAINSHAEAAAQEARRPGVLPAHSPPPPMLLGGIPPVAQQSVRVRSQLLDRLLNAAGEVMMTRSRLDGRMGSIQHSLSDLTHNLEKLRHQLRDMEVQAESQMQSRMQLSTETGADFDPLEFDRFTRVQELTRMMAESVNDVATVQRNLQRDVAGAEDDLQAQGRQARELQRDLLRTRMVEFDSIAERLYAVVRMTAKETGKQVKLEVSGGSIEMDRGVLERMVPAFEHLLRNSVGHGIEMAALRKAAGKPATGTINVRVQQEGNDVAIIFADDGAGLNVERIREKALALGWVAADDIVDASHAAQLVLMPGFSTADQLTGVSGRGIGMDVVRSEVQALGGRIETHTQAGVGASFRLVLPLTTAVTQVVMLRAGDFSVGVPASLVDVVRRVSLSDLEAAYRSGALADGAESIPFYWSGAVWSQSPRSVEVGAGKTRPVIIFRSASQRIALHVDEVLGHQEVVVKNLGPQMSRVPGLTGMSVLASGAVVLIYNPVALTAVYGDQIAQLGQGLPALWSAAQGQAAQRSAAPMLPTSGMLSKQSVPLVMVVDDSITVRRVSQRLLQRAGYRVVTAADGLQALEKLQDEVPSVLLSDIEMPRMDGFDLLRHIRAQAALQQLPIIMITSRIAQKHRDHAMALGANHYVGKPYSDEELMGLVHHHAVGTPIPAGKDVQAEGGGLPAFECGFLYKRELLALDT